MIIKNHGSEGDFMFISSFICDPEDICRDAESQICDVTPVCCDRGEEYLYELYRDIAESAMGAQLILPADTDAAFQLRLRAILRSAVYGSFSVMLRGVLSSDELSLALCKYNRIFCELESESREFNGYIPRGVCIDTPLLLFQPFCCGGLDFIVIDAERIVRLMTGNKAGLSSSVISSIAGSIADFARVSEIKRVLAIVGERSSSPLLINTLAEGGIQGIYLPFGKQAEMEKTILSAVGETPPLR